MKIDVEEIKKINLSPGDVIVFRLDFQPTVELFEGLTNSLKVYFPDNKSIVLTPGASFEVIGAAEATPS